MHKYSIVITLLTLLGIFICYKKCRTIPPFEYSYRDSTQQRPIPIIEDLPLDEMLKIKKGDPILTNHPDFFLDTSDYTFNEFNNAFGKFCGWEKVFSVYPDTTTLLNSIINER